MVHGSCLFQMFLDTRKLKSTKLDLKPDFPHYQQVQRRRSAGWQLAETLEAAFVYDYFRILVVSLPYDAWTTSVVYLDEQLDIQDPSYVIFFGLIGARS